MPSAPLAPILLASTALILGVAAADANTLRSDAASFTLKALAPDHRLPVPDSPDSAAVAEVVRRFHAALADADSATVIALLSDDAVILENGSVETKPEYRTHHLPQDIRFAGITRRTSGPLRVVVNGDVAWASSWSSSQVTLPERSPPTRSAELMVLVRTPAGWRISAIHWSTRAVRS
jgi:ketosteroid isomerase-like protein